MPIRHILCACLMSLLPIAAAGAPAECSVSSGTNRVALLELYTSEGCSSCPPADRWLSGLAAKGVNSERVVPLALHVDYWDYIGWRDRFAQPEFSERQRQMARLGNSTVVYTPQVMLNGRDFRNWRNSGHFERELAATNNSAAQATIRLTLKQPRLGTLDVSIAAQNTQEGNHALFFALYENNLTSVVKRGENAGSILHHDFVVRKWLGPFALNGKSPTSWRHEIKLDKEWNPESLGLAAFVQNTATGEVLQAVSRPLCTT
jgi:hypothetical protein